MYLTSLARIDLLPLITFMYVCMFTDCTCRLSILAFNIHACFCITNISAGPYLRKLKSSSKLVASRKTLLEGIIDAIDRRFAGDLHLFKGSSFVSFANWPQPVDGNLGRLHNILCIMSQFLQGRFDRLIFEEMLHNIRENI